MIKGFLITNWLLSYSPKSPIISLVVPQPILRRFYFMLYSLTRNFISFTTDKTEYLKCVAHFFTEEEAFYYEDLHNQADKEPDIYYETLISDTVDKCDFCGLEIAMLIWSE